LALLADALAPSGLTTTILATDVSAPVLIQARAALYSRDHLAEVPELLREGCFLKEDGRYRLEQRLREGVVFRSHNLITDEHYPQADLVLCRNVLIYFSEAEQARVLARFAAALPAGGVLVLGRTETLPRAAAALFRAEFPTERIFCRLAESAA
jgi:chemotaxis protein methyltransferase CheR